MGDDQLEHQLPQVGLGEATGSGESGAQDRGKLSLPFTLPHRRLACLLVEPGASHVLGNALPISYNPGCHAKTPKQ